MPSPTIDIGGTPNQYSVSLQSTGPTLLNVGIYGTVVQGAITHAAGGQSVFCGLSSGQLPAGSCSFNVSAVVPDNNNPGSGGVLVPGAATLRVDLYNGLALLSSKTVNVTVINTTPQVTSITPGPTLTIIGGGHQSFGAAFWNPGPSRSNIVYKGFIRQGAARRWAVGAPINCGSGAGILPNGPCTISSAYIASNTSLGSGTLVPGTASFEVEIQSSAGNTLSSSSVNVTIVGFPTVQALTAGAPLVGGPAVPYTVVIQNAGSSIPTVSGHATIVQGAASRDAGTLTVNCGNGAGTVPSGTCTFTGAYTASNASAGTGTLVPGSATLKIQFSDPWNGAHALPTVGITIVDPTPKITTLSLSSTTLTIGNFSQTYTALLINPGPPIASARLEASITQGAAQRSAGNQQLLCGVGGTDGLATGPCTAQANILVSNSGAGTGTLVAGAATLVVKLIDANTLVVLDTKSAPVTLQ